MGAGKGGGISGSVFSGVSTRTGFGGGSGAGAATRTLLPRARAVGFGAGFARRGFAVAAGGRFALPAFPDFPDVREDRALTIGVLRYCRPRAPSTTLPPSRA